VIQFQDQDQVATTTILSSSVPWYLANLINVLTILKAAGYFKAFLL